MKKRIIPVLLVLLLPLTGAFAMDINGIDFDFTQAGYIPPSDSMDTEALLILAGNGYDLGKTAGNQPGEQWVFAVMGIPSEGDGIANGSFERFLKGAFYADGQNICSFRFAGPFEVESADGQLHLKIRIRLYDGVNLTDEYRSIEYDGPLVKLPYSSIWG